MTRLLITLTIMLTLSHAQAVDDRIRTITLDPNGITPIRLGLETTTTIVFPKPIEAVVGQGIGAMGTENDSDFTFGPSEPEDALYLQCHQRSAKSHLLVRIDGRHYTLRLQWSITPDILVRMKLPQAEPTTTLEETTAAEILGQRPNYDSRNLLRLLRIARFASARRHLAPQIYPTLQQRPTRSERRYAKASTTITQIFRFPKDDALAFEVTLSATEDLRYDPKKLGIRIGESVYPVVFTNASGKLSRDDPVTIFALIMGGPTGHRESISIKNEFFLTLPPLSAP